MKKEFLFENNFNEIATIVSKINDSLIYLNEYYENLKSKAFKKIVSQNLALGFNSLLVLTDVVTLYANYFKCSIVEDNEFLTDTVNYAKSMLNSINNLSDNNLKNQETIIAYRTLSMAQQQIEYQFSASKINYIFLEYSIIISGYNIYHALNMVNNNYKNQTVKKRIKELGENALSFTEVSPILSLKNFFISIVELINAVENENASEEFVFSADNTATLLEKQSECLQYSYQGLLMILNILKNTNNLNANTV